MDPLVEEPRKPRSGARLVAAGVIGACALGVGLGLWARPAEGERPGVRKAAAPAPSGPAKPRPRLQIVVDDSPAPVGRPLEVLPAEIGPVGDFAIEPPAPRAQPAEPPAMAPRRPPSGLMKVAGPVVVEETLPAPKATPAVDKATRTPEPKARKAEAKPAPDPKPEKALAKADKKPAKAKPQLAAATKKKTGDAAKADKAKLAQNAKAKPKKTDAEAKPTRLAKVVGAVKSAPKKLKDAAAKPKPKPVELAKAKPKAKPVRTAKAEAKAPPKPSARPKPPGDGSTRIARGACAASDAGEALACADPRLSVRERQLQRAYRQA
jgi:hypothetical protein